MGYDGPPVAIASPAEDASSRVKIPVFVKPSTRCPAHAPDEIVVCAEDPEKFRLRPAPEKFKQDKALPPTQLKIGDKTSVGAELEAAGVGGWVSNRVMVRAKLKF